MAYVPTILSQVVAIISHDRFKTIVDRYKGDYRVQTFSCWSQLVVMLFAQLDDKESLRDLETALMCKKNFSLIWALKMPDAQPSHMPTRHAIGKSIATCFKIW
jgi:hypothetical protein